jgi:hypothetical protein
MRYDGLYKVVGYEVKNRDKQIHLFHLVREPDQGPIRHTGPEVRPTPEELEALAKAKIEKKYLAWRRDMNTAIKDIGWRMVANDVVCIRKKRDGGRHSCTWVFRIINPKYRVVGST